jgi:hypothetical protein
MTTGLDMRTFFCTVLLFILVSAPVWSQSDPKGDSLATSFQQPTTNGWTERRILATGLSVIIPGGGQSLLGHDEKGAAFTISFFGTALTAILAESNVIGRNERLNELQLQYAESRSYVFSDDVWNRMKQTKDIADSEAKRRDLFVKIAVVVWVANMVDMVFFTQERSEQTFGSAGSKEPLVALSPDPHSGFQARLTLHF